MKRELCPKCKKDSFWLYQTRGKNGTLYRNCRQGHKWVSKNV